MTKGKCLLIAEIGQAHDGSIGLAASYIDAVADIGADLVKFQMHIAEEESTLDEPFRTKFSLEDASRLDYWQRMEFSRDQWQVLFDRAQNRNVDFQGAFVALRKDGAVGASCLNKGFYYNVATKDSFDTVEVKGLLE